MKTNHTPGKLRVELPDGSAPSTSYVLRDEAGDAIALARRRDVVASVARANAARLALCWNMHDELVEALRLCITHPDACGFRSFKYAEKRLNAISDDARAVLAKLEGGSK